MIIINSLRNIIIGIALLFGFLSTLFGFYQLKLEDFNFHSFREVIIFFSLVVLIELVSRFYKINRLYFN